MDKVISSANTTLNKFLKEIILLNIISLAKIRKVIVRKSDTTYYSNYQSIIIILLIFQN